MLVVGAQKFESFWSRHPAAEPHLRALHALLARAPADQVERLLAGGERDGDGRIRLGLQTAVVRLRLGANGVVMVEGVEAQA